MLGTVSNSWQSLCVWWLLGRQLPNLCLWGKSERRNTTALKTKGGECQAIRELTEINGNCVGKCRSHRISRILLLTALWDNAAIPLPSDSLTPKYPAIPPCFQLNFSCISQGWILYHPINPVCRSVILPLCFWYGESSLLVVMPTGKTMPFHT